MLLSMLKEGLEANNNFDLVSAKIIYHSSDDNWRNGWQDWGDKYDPWDEYSKYEKYEKYEKWDAWTHYL